MMHGEIWWADFGIPFGSEPGYNRPVLIIQDDTFNKSKINTIVVLPLTTKILLENAPGNIFIGKEESGMPKDSVIVVSQLYAIDRQRLLEQVSKLQMAIMKEVESGIKLVIGIR